jgi:hypothetical protein
MTATADIDPVPLVFSYRNWRGEVSERRVIPIRVWFGATEWHPEPQWFLNANDLDKGETRDFALRDIGARAGGVRVKALDVDALAQEIRRVDGQHSLGAGALAEALMPFLSAREPAIALEVPSDGAMYAAESRSRMTPEESARIDAYLDAVADRAFAQEGAKPLHCLTVNTAAGFSEFVVGDPATVVQELPGGCALLLDIDTREVIGFRWPHAKPTPAPEADVVGLVDELRSMDLHSYEAWGTSPGAPMHYRRVDVGKQAADRIEALQAEVAEKDDSLKLWHQTACEDNERATAAEASLAAARDEVERKDRALDWYAEKVAGCRMLTNEGDSARAALDADGGARARAALGSGKGG